MGCNCKKNTYDKLKKYADNREEIEKEELNQNLIDKIALFITQIVFGIFTAIVFIIVIIPLILYIVFCIIIGKEPQVIIKNPKNFFKKHARK